MDPLTALSLAGNIIQFVDFGIKLLSTTRELYHSSVGSLAAHDELELIITDLSALIEKLKRSSVSRSDSYGEFNKICDDAEAVATEIVTRLGELKVDKEKLWELKYLNSIRKAFKGIWTKPELNVLVQRLASLREALDSRILFNIGEKLEVHSMQTAARFDSIDRQTQQIFTAILESKREVIHDSSGEFKDDIATLTTAIAQLLSRVESLNHDNHQYNRHDISANSQRVHTESQTDWSRLKLAQRSGVSKSEEITANIELLDVTKSQEQLIRSSVQRTIIQSLDYGTITTRYEQIEEAHSETFNWAFYDPEKDQLPWSNLSNWLKTDTGVYWVSGKAGSGKSTFMKHLHDSERTQQCLRIWAGRTSLCIATFYFWNSGTAEQKSQLGCLRALLFQILKQFPHLVPLVLPGPWATQYSQVVLGNPVEDAYFGSWSLRKLKEAFRYLTRLENASVKICLFIDGLDEFDGDHDSMATFFKEITDSKIIKVCLSSRPWVVFEDIFHGCPGLRLQNLTFQDIERYVKDKLSQNDAFRRLASKNPFEAKRLKLEIVEKADGVFLWVVLVVLSLLRGIRNRDNISDLWERLRLLPKELEPLYHRLLDLIEPLYMSWASKAFQIVRTNHLLGLAPFGLVYGEASGGKALTLGAFTLAMNTEVGIEKIRSWDVNMLPLDVNCDDMLVQLTVRCAGLLEVSKATKNGVPLADSAVQYYHRTARDFLETKSTWSRLLSHTSGSDFDPAVAMMRSCLMSLRLGTSTQLSSTRIGTHLELTENFMTYAYHADAHTKSHATQHGLLDCFNKIRTRDSGHSNKWMLDLVLLQISGSHLTFTEFSALYGLRGYLEEKLCQFGEVHTKEESTKLLRFVLRFHGCSNRFGKLLAPSAPFKIIPLLLEYGADPNDTEDGLSAWQEALQRLVEPSLVPQGHLMIMKILVQSGADLGEQLPGMGYGTLKNFVKNFLLRKYPQEATELLQVI